MSPTSISQPAMKPMLGPKARAVYWNSGDAPPMVAGNGSMATIAAGAQMRERFSYPSAPPAWLTPEDLAAIEEVTPRGSVAGPRYGPEHMARVNV